MTISLAPAALQRVQGYLVDAPDALGLRFGVKRTGWSTAPRSISSSTA
jgi:iron-sulfur cluster assembly protein